MKRFVCIFLVFALVLSLLSGCGAKNGKTVSADNVKLDLGSFVSEEQGNTNEAELKFDSDESMLASMKLACRNENLELYYSPDNMTVALKDIKSGKITASNPYDAALDSNYSGDVGERLASQVIISYLENETKIVDMYSFGECAKKGQYAVKIYEKGLSFDLIFGTDNSSGAAYLTVLSKDAYEDIISKISEDSTEIFETYFTFIKKDELGDSGIFDAFPEISKQDVYYCDFELSERDQKKISAIFKEAGYTAQTCQKEAQKLNLGKTTKSDPYFKLSLEFMLTDTGVTVSVPNKSIEYNPDFPLLRICLLPYFGADKAASDSKGYLFIPDGSGTIINMNKDVPNRRTIITGKVYGENASRLPKNVAAEKTEQYYLPVFGTVRNNDTGLFGIITSGDSNSEITALLGRPNGNYYSTYPEFILRDYEQYTRISVVENAWSNKLMYLYEKTQSKEDLTVQYTFLKDGKANYSSMAKIYRDYLLSGVKEADTNPTLNIETVGSALVKKSVLGFTYDTEAVFTSYEDDISILEYLKKNKADNLSLLLKGWQKDGLDAAISGKVRLSSDLGGNSGMNKLSDYCKDNGIGLSIYNDISFVGADKNFDGFSPKSDASRTLELKYARNSQLSPDTMLYDEGKYIVKASSYAKYLSGLTKGKVKFSALFNMGTLGSNLSSDYTKETGINRGDSKRYITAALKDNKGSGLAFDKGNAYVLPYAKTVSGISVDNSSFPGETATVPFIQMVLSGKISYNSEPINLKEDIRLELLKCIESGTAPTFLLSFKNTSALKETNYTEFYSIDYEILKKDMVESYKYVDKTVKAVSGSELVSHSILSDGVTVSVYGNGKKIYVNKTDNDFAADGITVKARDYAIKG